jgi:hypothetical protein
MAMYLRLGLSPMDIMPANCHSCSAPIMDADAPLLSQDMWHWLGAPMVWQGLRSNNATMECETC